MSQLEKRKNGHAWPGEKAGKQYNPVPWPRDLTGPASIEQLVNRAAKHYKALHAANGGRIEIHVYPASKSDRGHSADFRHFLACSLIDHGWIDRYFTGYRSPTKSRREAENEAAANGFIFIEYVEGS